MELKTMNFKELESPEFSLSRWMTQEWTRRT